MLIYDGRDRVIARLPFADTANLAMIMLDGVRGDSVAPSQLATRSCVGIALFSKREWAALTSNGRSPNDVRPSEATMRLRVYPATKTARAVVENVLERKAFFAEGLEYMQNPPPPKTRADSSRTPITWSVQTYLDNAQGPCTVE